MKYTDIWIWKTTELSFPVFILKFLLRVQIFLLLGAVAGAWGGVKAQGDGPPRFDYTLRDPLAGYAQNSWLTPADTFHRKRFYVAAGTGAALYTSASIGLYAIWYRDYPQGSFRIFNDWPEWNQMDKAGHAFTAYLFSRYAYAGLRWSGLKRPAARWTAFGVANLLQGTIEVFDGFAELVFGIADFRTVGHVARHARANAEADR